MTAERRERGYLCRTEVTAAPALSLNLFWNLPAHWLIRVTRPLQAQGKCQGKNHRVLAVDWFCGNAPSYRRS